MLVDLGEKCSGKDAEDALGLAGITVNKNLIPFDEQPAQKGSGIRIGASAICSRGMGAAQGKAIALLISKALKQRDDEAVLNEVREAAGALCAEFPIYK